MRHVLTIDQGTTGTTCLVIDEAGRVAGRAYRELTQHYPRPGWVEHDPEELLRSCLEAGREAIARAGAAPEVVGITNQRETVVLWERAGGRAVAPAIVWQDRRTADRCRALAPRAPEIARLTGLVTDPYFSATKLEWLLRDPVLAARAQRGELAAGTVDAWLVYRLTGGRVHATDFTNASRTMLFDIERRAWSPELCAEFGVPEALLPRVLPSNGDYGVAEAGHFGGEVPIRGVVGDQQAALFGQGCWREGEGKNTYGTGAFLLFNVGRQRPEGGGGLLTTLACDAQGQPVYALEASIFVAGAAVQWLRDGLQLLESAAESEEMARLVETNGGVYFVPALVGLGAPHWEPEARGTIVGITRGTSRAHLVRAALEAMAYGTRDVLDSMRRHARTGIERLRVDGGATTNGWLMQFQADVLQVPVERPDMVETTALGAAGLAGLASGVWKSPEDFLAARTFSRFSPAATAAEADAWHRGWLRAVDAVLSWARSAC